jgi:hypothetical protein
MTLAVEQPKRKVYVPEPTPQRFHWDSHHFVRGIMGPLGSGKSVACVMEIWNRAIRQEPDKEGVRRTRWAVIRNTYPQLTTTTLKTWMDWFDPRLCPVRYTAPIKALCNLPLDDGTRVDFEVLFLAIDKPGDVDRLLSLEVTGAWINEARELPKAVIDMITGRVGRYPPKFMAPLTWSGVFMDSNPPDNDHWWYHLAEEDKPDNWAFFRQPPALIPQNGRYVANVGQITGIPPAEGVQHQPKGFNYWLEQIGGKDKEWIKVYILGQYGSVFDGKPVYENQYNDLVHVSRDPLKVYNGLPVILGWDFGMTPACAFSQLTPQGGLNVVREEWAEFAGLKQFASTVVLPRLALDFPNMPVISWTDPAGAQSAQTDEQTCLDVLLDLGVPSHVAPTNKFLPRREAVATFLTRMIDGKAGFQLDPSCIRLRKGFQGGYMFSRIQVSGPERYHDMPVKNEYSHIHDALQYNALGALYGSAMNARTPGKKSARRQTGSKQGFR